MFCRTVRQGKRANSWKTTAVRGRPLAGGGPPAAWRKRTRPSSGLTSPATMLSRVDLPQPLGPRMATNSPSRVSKLTDRRASTSPRRPPYRLETPSITTRISEPCPRFLDEAQIDELLQRHHAGDHPLGVVPLLLAEEILHIGDAVPVNVGEGLGDHVRRLLGVLGHDGQHLVV